MAGISEKLLGSKLRVSTVVIAVFCSLLASAGVVFGRALSETGFAGQPFSLLMIRCLLLAIVFFALYFVAARLVIALGKRLRAGSRGVHRRWSIAPRETRKSLFVHICVMLAFWAVYIVALYPGSMNWDTYYQIYQCYPDAQILMIPWAPTESFVDAAFSDHHPLFDTLLFGAFAHASEALFGTWNYGVFLFVVLQAIFTAAVFTASVAYLVRLRIPYAVRSVVFVVYCVLPFFPIYAATMLKDSLFSPLFVLYLLFVCEAARTQGACFAGRVGRIIAFAIIGVLLALTKKPGMYVVLASAVILVFSQRKAWRAYVAQLVSVVVVMMLILPRIVFPLLDVVPGGTQEALAAPFQQTARFVVLYPDEVTAQERASIDALLRYDDIPEDYDPFSCDYVKNWYKYETATSDDIVEYAKTYLAQGLRHPEVYFEALAATSAPYVNCSGPIDVYMYTGDVEHYGSPLVSSPEALEPLRSLITRGYDFASGLPGLGVLLSVGLYAFVLPSISLVTLSLRRSRLTAVFVPIALSLAVCFITPIFSARYALPIIYAAPMLFSLCFSIADARHRRR